MPAAPPPPDGTQQQFDASTIEKFRKVRTRATDPSSAPNERAVAAALLRAMVQKYPGLQQAVQIRDEFDRRAADAKARGPSSSGPGGTGPFGGIPRPGDGVDPFQHIPRAVDFVETQDFGNGFIGEMKRAAAQKLAEFADRKIQGLKADWEKLSIEEIERQLREGFGPPGANPSTDPLMTAERRAKMEKHQMGALQDLLRDPETTEAGVELDEDEDGTEVIQFDLRLPEDVWNRLVKQPHALTSFLQECVEEAYESDPDDDEGDEDPDSDDDTFVPEDDDEEGPDVEIEDRARPARAPRKKPKQAARARR